MIDKVRIGYFSEKCKEREINQDNFYVEGHINYDLKFYDGGSMESDEDEIKIVSVFDGMGGERNGEIASLVAADTIGRIKGQLNDDFSREKVRGVLASYYDVFLDGLENAITESYSRCGTTCAGVIFDFERMIPFWIGDSRVYVLRKNQLLCLTKDHTVAQNRIDNGDISEEKARTLREWHMLYNYMGEYDAIFSVGEQFELQKGDRVLLCSDGLIDLYMDDELKELIIGNQKEVLRKLESIAKDKAEDNFTVIIVDFLENNICEKWKSIIRRFKECIQLRLKEES